MHLDSFISHGSRIDIMAPLKNFANPYTCSYLKEKYQLLAKSIGYEASHHIYWENAEWNLVKTAQCSYYHFWGDTIDCKGESIPLDGWIRNMVWLNQLRLPKNKRPSYSMEVLGNLSHKVTSYLNPIRDYVTELSFTYNSNCRRHAIKR